MDLAPGEHALFQGHPSWRSILRFYAGGLVVAAVAGAIAAVAKSTGLGVAVGIAVLAAVVVVGWLRRLGTTYTITNRRLHIRRGLLARHEQETRLDRVQNVNTDQSVFERLLRIGTVDFDTAGTDDSDFRFTGVASPRTVVQAVDRAQHEAAQAPDEPPATTSA